MPSNDALDLQAFVTTLHWQPGPAVGVDVLAKQPTEDNENPSGIECGDRLLVLVAIQNSIAPGEYYWDPQVIIATETGFDDTNGDSWSAWSWSDVSWWVKLSGKVLPSISAT